jgi:hypothetical protein
MEEREIIAALSEPFSLEAIKELPGRGKNPDGSPKTFSYIEGHTAILRLNASAPGWSFAIKEYRIEADGRLGICLGTLTIPAVGSRSDIGTCPIIQPVERKWPDGNTRGWDMFEESYKGAVTDCIKRCARQFGVALYLYGPDYEGEAAMLDSGAVPVQSAATITGTNLPNQTSASLAQKFPPRDQPNAPQAAMPVQGTPTLPGQVSPVSQAPSAPQAPSGEHVQDTRPITDNQIGKIYYEANRLSVDADSLAFNDAVALQFGAPFKKLSLSDARDLIDVMVKNPEKLDASALPKAAVLGGLVAEYFTWRIENAQDVSEAQSLLNALKSRYAKMAKPDIEALTAALAKWGIGMAGGQNA